MREILVSMLARLSSQEEPLPWQAATFPFEVACFRCAAMTKTAYTLSDKGFECRVCALVSYLITLTAESESESQLESAPAEPIVYVPNNGGPVVTLRNTVSEEAPNVKETLRLVSGETLQWNRDESGNMVPSRFQPKVSGAQKTGSSQYIGHTHETPEVDLSQLDRTEAALYEGYSPGVRRIATSGDVLRYEAEYGDAELMALLEEEDLEYFKTLPESEQKLYLKNRREYTGVVRTSAPKPPA
jgi:hypothetical protein